MNHCHGSQHFCFSGRSTAQRNTPRVRSSHPRRDVHNVHLSIYLSIHIVQVLSPRVLLTTHIPLYYGSFHFLFHYPYKPPIYYSSFHLIFHYPNITPIYTIHAHSAILLHSVSSYVLASSKVDPEPPFVHLCPATGASMFGLWNEARSPFLPPKRFESQLSHTDK